MSRSHQPDWASLIPDAPFDWALIPIDDHKRPIDPSTGQPMAQWQEQPGYDVDGLAQLNGCVKAAGLILGPPSGGVLAVDFDGPGAPAKFHEAYGRPATDLPPTVGVTSGKPCRGQRLFQVDPDWWPHLRGRRVWKQNGEVCLELRWAGHQSVIAGAHPETEGYRWMPQSSPAEREVAMAPEWLLEPLLRAEARAEAIEPSSDDAKRAIAMLQHIDPLSRTDYDSWIEVGMALFHTDPGLLADWVSWSGALPNFDEAECLSKWESFGAKTGSRLTIRSLHHWAKDGGYQEPKRAKPQQPVVPLMPAAAETAPQPEALAKPAGVPQGHQAKGFIEEAAALREALDGGLRAIDAMSDVAMRSVGLVQLRRNLGLQEKDFLALVNQLAEHQEDLPPEDFDALLTYAESISAEPIIEDLLAVGLTLLAGEGGAGKSSVGYQLVEAVTTGGKFAGQFQAKQAPCLVVQLDESVKDAGVKWRVMGFAPNKRLVHFLWKFNPMMFPELRAKVRETGARVVILDSLLKVAGGTISPKDAEFGLLIYRLNQLAAELGIAIVCIHHLVKADKAKKRVDVTKDDIYGSAYVFNGAADVWGYWGFREDGNPDPLYALKVLKNRSSLVEVNTTYEFEGSAEDQRISFRGMANRTITLDEIKTHRERVRTFLLSRPGTVFNAKQINGHTGVGSEAYARRLLTELYQARVGVDRKQLPSTGGRPPYGYFASEGSSQPRARVILSPKETSLSALSLDSLSVGGGFKGVSKAQKLGGFLSLEPQGNTREDADHGFGPNLDEYLERLPQGMEEAA